MLMAMHPPGFPAAIPPLVGATLRLREVLQRNHASVRLLEKCGFSFLEVVPPSAAEPEVLLRYARTRRGAVGDRERPSVPAI